MDNKANLKTSTFTYTLPPELIAQKPIEPRDSSRMLVLSRTNETFSHNKFSSLPNILKPKDLLIINDTRVFPARVFATREVTGGVVEVLFTQEVTRGRWKTLTRSGGHLNPGEILITKKTSSKLRLAERLGNAGDIIELPDGTDAASLMENEGAVPLPPYIHRDSGPTEQDRERYQTVYAQMPGAVAAPTAGLHFTTQLINSLNSVGVSLSRITLHVGPGTFKPVKTEFVKDHSVDPERFIIPEETANTIRSTRAAGGRIVAVGTTVVRTLESQADDSGNVRPGAGETALYIFPPYRFKVVDALITNFHLPCSSLLLLVCAFAGTDRVLNAYRVAVNERYRFYSYGDAMYIE